MKNHLDERTGVFIVLVCGIAWGMSGVMSQIIFSASDMSPQWLVVMRMFIAGSCILIFKWCKTGKDVFCILKEGKDFCRFIFFALGVVMMQYSYSLAIDSSNAATATVLQYTYPVFILMYTSIEQKKLPKLYEFAAVLSAFVGIYLIATHGNPHTLQISTKALFWGIMSSFAFVMYTVYPKKLYSKYDGAALLGMAMFIGSISLFGISGCYNRPVTVTPLVVVLTICITLFGCMLPLLTYNRGVEMLGNVRASLFVTVEPVFCALLSAVLGLSRFQTIDIAGFLFILIPVEAVAIKSFKKSNRCT